ncbi:DNA-binding LacI/PurR family transcriptional regulator [Hamadaea flava]|uniref:LacI family DNA-binding transcriptional regulator n=1 Tax=Hamadaea flava TaxID=1742688 RepID=A0ABV8LQ09_9ACTN|nr:LacI family DNA-binding transcriptional regulator [Hamadaea flava]MCP2329635.1 DNA-binding LacI/PurR family transcriptional regulator [Hamadaea flava]
MSERQRIGRRRVTQQDVARAANVSTAIVSTVVNNKADTLRVSEQTRARVWQAIQDLRYVPNAAAQSLAGGRNRLIGAFTYQRLFPWESRDFYYEFLLGIEEEAEQTGHNLLLFTGARNDAGERSIFNHNTNLLELADGAILVGGRIDGDEIQRLAEEKYPFVMIGRRDAAGPKVSWIAADYTAATQMVVDRLHALGHRTMLLVVGSRTHETVLERRAGFEAARRRHRLGDRAQLVVFGEPNPDLPEATCVADEAEVLRFARAAGATAVIAESSYVIHRIYQAALAEGLRIPQDLSLVGLGDHGDRQNVLSPDPALTLVHTPSRLIGATAVRTLLRRLDAPESKPDQIRIPCELSEGTTVAAPPRRKASQ